jgi:hypothetical protein
MQTRTIALAAVIIAATAALAITPIVSMSAFAVKDTRCAQGTQGVEIHMMQKTPLIHTIVNWDLTLEIHMMHV